MAQSRANGIVRALSDRVSTKEAAGIIGRHVQTLRRWQRQNYGPRWFVIGGRREYRLDDIERWVEEQKR